MKLFRSLRRTTREIATIERTHEEDYEKLIATGQQMEDRGDFVGAVACYESAVSAAPSMARAHVNLANALNRSDRSSEAIMSLRRAIACAPDYAPAHFNLGVLFHQAGDTRPAENALREALRCRPSMVEAMLILADILEVDGRVEDAEGFYQRALCIAPDHAGLLLNYGMYCSRRHRFDDALMHFKQAKVIEPGFREVESNLVFSLNFRTDIDALTAAEVHKRAGMAITAAAPEPFSNWSNAAIIDRPLRIGYVSGDFRIHPVAVFLRPVLERHDRSDFQIWCYSNYPKRDAVGDLVLERSDCTRMIANMADEDLAQQIRDDKIDILVDLSGHSARHRLPVFARHPAPVQVTWLGYLNTTGLPAMDYRICDQYTDPPGSSETLSTERLVRLPHSQWCYLPWHDATNTVKPHDDRPGAIVFGSFNQDRKINDQCLSLWCQVLALIPEAELLVLDFSNPAMQRNLLERVERHGVDPKRISIRGRETVARYFEILGTEVDIAFDTFPYNGATTTLDTLWMGVPVVAMAGERGISRSAYSILKSAGLDELIATTPNQYVELNVLLARDAQQRNALRQSLRMKLRQSPLMDTEGFTRDLEALYRQMWHQWCARQ